MSTAIPEDTAAFVAAVTAAGSWASYSRQTGVATSTVRGRAARLGVEDEIMQALKSRASTLADEVAAARREAEKVKDTLTKAQTGEEKPRSEVNGDKATIITRPAPSIADEATLIREAGLDPDEWEIDRARMNQWDALAQGEGDDGKPVVVTLYQLRCDLKRKVSIESLFVQPAEDVKQRRAPQARKRAVDQAEKVVFFPDQHAPYHDERLHELAMRHLADWQPDRIVNLGDLCDFPTISRHRDNPAYAASARECVQAGFAILSDQRAVAPDATIVVIEGNHDARPRTELLTRAERMYDLRPATVPGRPEPLAPWSLPHLLHFDKLHVGFVGPDREGDNYFQGVLELAPEIAAVHGFITGSNSASGTVERIGMSTFFGHSHRQKVHHVTKYRGKRIDRELVGIECGTMRRIEGGGGFTMNANWQAGYATATVWPDGTFTYDLARFDGETLTWRDQRFA